MTVIQETPRAYLTLRCNLSCSYCSNGQEIAHYDELSAQEWVRRLRKFTTTDDVVFTGGEPTLHRQFCDVLNAVGKERRIIVYSNMTTDIDLSALPPPSRLSWRASCHAQVEREAIEWICRVHHVHRAGYKMHLTTVLPPPKVLAVLKEYSISVDEPQYKPTPLPPPVRCTLPRYLLAPDGVRYHCVGKLVRKDPSGIVPDGDGNTVICQTPDQCAACDSIASQRRPMT